MGLSKKLGTLSEVLIVRIIVCWGLFSIRVCFGAPPIFGMNHCQNALDEAAAPLWQAKRLNDRLSSGVAVLKAVELEACATAREGKLDILYCDI